MAAHFRIDARHVFGPAADLLRQIPPLKRLVMSVSGPHLVDQFQVQVYLAPEEPLLPVFARIVHAEIERHAVFVGQREEHLHQIDRWIVHLLAFEQALERRGDPPSQPGADQHHGVDPHVFHRPEIGVPLPDAPVLVGNVPAHLVEKRRADRNRFEDAFGPEIRVRQAASRVAARRTLRGAGRQHDCDQHGQRCRKTARFKVMSVHRVSIPRFSDTPYSGRTSAPPAGRPTADS